MCKMHYDKLSEKFGSHFYFVFRVFVGILFLQHGVQKLFGWFGGLGGQPAELFSLMGLAGVIETAAGLGIALGLLTRVVASVAALEMLAAYFTVHFPQGYVPLVNQGELALMYFASFLVLTVKGAGKWNLEQLLFKREIS